jgi:uncharacterized phage-like protein YoqJ
MKKWIWQGNCVNSFDEEGDSLIPAFSDASAFAVSEEAATLYIVSNEDVFQSPSDVPKKLEFTFDESSGVLMGYDAANDIHHFFISERTQQHTSRQLMQ